MMAPDLLVPGLPVLALLVVALLLLGVLARRSPALAVCVVPLSFPVGQRALPGPLPLDLVQAVAAAAVGFVGLLWLRRGRPVAPPAPVLVAAGLLVLSALLATVVAPDPAAALRLDLGYLAGLALAVAVVVACRDVGAVRLVALAVCAGGGTVCATGLGSAGRLRAQYGGALVQNRAEGIFGQPNELGGFAAAVLVLSLALLFGGRGRQPAVRLVAAAAALSAGAALALSLSRGAWIGAALGVGVLVVLLPGRGRLLAAVAAVAVAGAAATVVLPDQQVVSVVADRLDSVVSGDRNPYDQRPDIWREAIRQLAGSPVVGVGPGGYPVHAARADPLREAAPEHAHSLLLTVGAEQGLLGVAGLLAVVLAGVATVVRGRRVRTRRNGGGPGEVVLAGAAAALAAVLGQGLVDYPLRNPVLGTLLWLLVGLLVAAAGRAQEVLTVRRPVSTGLAVKSSR